MTVDPSSLATGEILVTVSNPDPSDGPSGGVLLTILPPGGAAPAVAADGVVHAATFLVGVAAQGVVYQALEIPSVFVGGVEAEVLFAGRAPGVVGLYQINIRVPDGAAADDAVVLAVAVKGVAAPEVSIAIGSI